MNARVIGLALLVTGMACGRNAMTPQGHVNQFPATAAGAFPDTAPADSTLAVGPSTIVEVSNQSISVWSKTGDLLRRSGFTSLFGASNACDDPRVIYWSWSDRFAAVCTDIGVTPKVIRLAVSTSGNPALGWYTWTMGAVNDTVNGYDQPSVVATLDKLVVTAYYCPPSSSPACLDADHFFVFRLADMLNGTASPAMVHLTSSTYALNKPAVQLTPTNAAYFVDVSNPSRHVRLTTITGVPALSRLSFVSLTVSDLGADTLARPPSSVPLPGLPIDNLGSMTNIDDRVLTAVYEVQTADNKPVIQYSVNAGCGGRACIGTGRVLLDGTPRMGYQVTWGEANYDYTWPAVGLDDYGHWIVVYTRSSLTQSPQAVMLSLAFNQIIYDAAPGTTACDANYQCAERWGDYLGVAQDPSSRSHVWAAGEYQAASGAFGWGTVIAQATYSGVQ